MITTVYTLLVVVLSSGGASSFTRDHPTEEACRLAEAQTIALAHNALGVLDLGTICVKSELSQLIKPRA